jgi:putative heme-binding domain-containing protein
MFNQSSKRSGLRGNQVKALGQAFLKCSSVFAVVMFAVEGTPLRAQTADHPGEYAQADIQHGFQLYMARCTVCHGVEGDEIRGVALRSGRFRRAATDRQLMTLITTGISDAGMPPSGLNEPEQVSIVAYLRNMSTFDAGAVPPGDVNRGRLVFESRGACTKCHRLDGRTVGLAPDLGGIGAIRTPSALQRSLLDPSAAMHPINRPIRAVTRDGKVINGRRLNEDSYTVQLMDEQGHLLSLDKADLREYTISKASPKPSYKDKLSNQEIADLVAYLVSLKGS